MVLLKAAHVGEVVGGDLGGQVDLHLRFRIHDLHLERFAPLHAEVVVHRVAAHTKLYTALVVHLQGREWPVRSVKPPMQYDSRSYTDTCRSYPIKILQRN